MDQRMLDMAFQKPLQVTSGSGENAFESHKSPTHKMVDQEPRDVGALAGLMVVGKGYGVCVLRQP
jgi:hypothetical protein